MDAFGALPYDRTLMNQVRSGKGKGVKKLRDEITSNPKLTTQFFKERGIEIENGKQREKMMWVKDANSRVRRVESDGREACVFTNPMNVHTIPNRSTVVAAKARSSHAPSGTNGMSLFN